MKNWYIVQVHRNNEISVANKIKELQSKGYFSNIVDIYVPTETVIYFNAKNVKTEKEKAIYQGYIFIQIENYHEHDFVGVRNLIPKFSAIIPQIMTEEEINKMRTKVNAKSSEPRYNVTFQKGDKVRIVEGAFENFTGEVSLYNPELKQVEVDVMVFSRPTPTTFNISQVRLNS